MNRRRFLDRTHRQRARQRKASGGFNPGAMIRLAGFGAALMVGVAVYIGFARQGETIYDGRWGVMQRLVSPLFLGFNVLDLIVLALVGLVAWRIWQRMQTPRN
jgi:hypothetical protein